MATSAAAMSSSTGDAKAPTTKVQSPSRLLQRYKSLEDEAKSYLGKGTNSTYTRRARAFEPTLDELQQVSFADYVRYAILNCGGNHNLQGDADGEEEEQQEGDTNSKTPRRTMHTRNNGSRKKKTTNDYSTFHPPACWSDGMAKVTHPSGWWDLAGIGKDTTARGPNWQPGTKLGDMMVQSPIKQCVSGIGGVYEYTLLDLPSLSLSEFRVRADAYRKRQIGKVAEEDTDDDTCDLLARKFWKRLGPTMEAPQYGADMDGSLFDGDEACGWNVEKLESCLQLLSPAKGERLPGVTSPYLYVGMWGSVFCAHTEDMNLLSINYLHAGAPKYWYAIAPEDTKRFESLMEHHFVHSAQKCGDFLRHKRNLLSPAILMKAGISFTTQIQRPGDAMITFPGSYHFGFNTGFNVAESTNFAVPEWISKGLEANVCMCHPHSVRIDMAQFQSLLQRYEADARRARRVGYRQLSYSAWIDRENEKHERNKVSSDEDEAADVSSTNRKRDGFLVEVVRPLPSQKGTSMSGMKRALSKSKKSSTSSRKEVEDWRLARRMFRGSIAPQTRVLCFMVADEEAQEQAFAGVISEVVDKHVRIHFAGMNRTDDVWMPSGSPKLFLDGGRQSPPPEVQKKTAQKSPSRKKSRR